MELKERLKSKAAELGFADCGVAGAQDLEPQAQSRLREWLERGCHDRMDYLARDPLRRCRPRQLLEGAQSVICLSAQYRAIRNESPPPPGCGRIARYARGEDYHQVLDGPLRQMEAWLLAEGGPDTACRRFCDAGPLLERAFAQRAGLGFIGRNTLLIKPGAGSWMLLAAIITNLPIEPDTPLAGTCGACTRCLDACPTQAFPQPGVLDARRCISNLTIERRGEFSPEEARMPGQWLFGCDICQEVCPYNTAGAEPSFAPLDATIIPDGRMRLADLAAFESNKQFERAFARSPLLRARLKGLRRNAEAIQNASEDP